MTLDTPITRPDLTLPDTEAHVLQDAFERADVILEYGSGGSTVMAADMPGKRIFSVENDKSWVQMMRAWFEANRPAEGSDVDIIWSDTGNTKKWGYPVDTSQFSQYAQYPLKVWDLHEFRQPDVVFIDGRFRAGCALATALRTQKPVQVLIDDYAGRTRLHEVERFIGRPALHGRMAEFDVEPMALNPEHLLDIIDMMTRP